MSLNSKKLAIIAAIATYLSLARKEVKIDKSKPKTSYWRIATKIDILVIHNYINEKYIKKDRTL